MSEMQHRGKLRKPIWDLDRKLQDPLLTGFVPIFLVIRRDYRVHALRLS